MPNPEYYYHITNWELRNEETKHAKLLKVTDKTCNGQERKPGVLNIQIYSLSLLLSQNQVTIDLDWRTIQVTSLCST